jgi:hypothetical protein
MDTNNRSFEMDDDVVVDIDELIIPRTERC